jgi:hypothetical protein
MGKRNREVCCHHPLKGSKSKMKENFTMTRNVRTDTFITQIKTPL